MNSSTTALESTATTPSPAPTMGSVPIGGVACPTLRAWLVRRRNEGATPEVISSELIVSGWDADEAARVALSSLRRADFRRLTYICLCWGAGLAALGAGTAAHLALRSDTNPIEVAWFVTLMLVAAPIAAVSGFVARKAEAEDAFAIWSPTRRVLFATLAASTAAVGLVRLLHYTFNVVAASLGAEGYELTGSSFVQVFVTLVLAVPLFGWSLTEWRRSNVAHKRLTRDAGE